MKNHMLIPSASSWYLSFPDFPFDQIWSFDYGGKSKDHPGSVIPIKNEVNCQFVYDQVFIGTINTYYPY